MLFLIGVFGFCILVASPASGWFPTNEYQAEEVVGKTPSQILRMRGFDSEEHYVKTKDGYTVHLLRVIHPMFKPSKRPIIFNHGLIETSVFWLISSKDVTPFKANGCGSIPAFPDTDNKTFYSNGPMMLSSAGYDVWLLSMRGTEMAMGEQGLPPPLSDFWDFSLDDYALSDTPAAIDFVRKHTGAPKVGYIGHSQATFSIFALLSTTPSYADVVEPVVAIAPVAYFRLITSVNRLLYDFAWLIDLYENRSGRFPLNAAKIRKLVSGFCAHSRVICYVIKTKIGGKGEKWPGGFWSQLPYTSSWKVLRHFGQLSAVNSFQRYDYGPKMNSRLYHRNTPPPYNESQITSKSLILIYSKTDALATPRDIERFKRGLTVPLYKDIYIDRNYDHFDLVTGSLSAKLVYKPILEACEKFEAESGSCSGDKNGTRAEHSDEHRKDKGETRSGLLEEEDESKAEPMEDEDAKSALFDVRSESMDMDEQALESPNIEDTYAYEEPRDGFDSDNNENDYNNDNYEYDSNDSASG